MSDIKYPQKGAVKRIRERFAEAKKNLKPSKEMGEIIRISTTEVALPEGASTHATNRTIEPVIFSASGVKHDSEKPKTELLSPIAMIEIAKVMGFGMKKYSAHNWRGGIAWSRVLGAALRHLFAFLGGEDKDPETGLSHLAHASCCLMFLLEYEVTHKELDDRYVHTKK